MKRAHERRVLKAHRSAQMHLAKKTKFSQLSLPAMPSEDQSWTNAKGQTRWKGLEGRLCRASVGA